MTKTEGAIAGLGRRIALGVAACSLIACGGSDFSSAPTHAAGSAGMSAVAGAGMGSGGSAGSMSPGEGGAGGDPGSAYEGPPFVTVEDDGAIVVRGLEGPTDSFTFHVEAPYHGSKWQLDMVGLTINDDPWLVGFNHTLSTHSVDGATETVEAPIGSTSALPSLDRSVVLVASAGRVPPAGGEIDIVDDVALVEILGADRSVLAAWP